jgi:hypothetical protein
MTNPAVIQLSLATALPAYRPGETVMALLHASTSLPEDIELKEVEIVFSGVERVDTSWVSPSYRKNVPAINSDRRRVQRNVVKANLQAATQGNFSDANLRRFLVRCKLPSWLPPTFKGTAVRYSYYLDAHLSYFQYEAGVVAAAAATGIDPPKQGTPGSISTRLALHIWPDQESPIISNVDNSAAANINNKSSSSSSLHHMNKTSGDVFPIGEDAPIKCWEVGPGTAVEDAISHISKLITAGSGIPPSPFSPGRMKTSMSRQESSGPLLAASGVLGSGALGSRRGHSDSASEISHDEGPASTSQSAQLAAGGIHTANRPRSGGAPPSASRASLASETTERSTAAITTTTATTGTAVQSAEAGGAGGLRIFSLRIGDAPLCRVSVHPPLMGPLQPGATVACTLEFITNAHGSKSSDGVTSKNALIAASNTLRCMQVSVALETEEVVDFVWRPVGKGANASSTTSRGTGGDGLRKLLEEQIEVTAETSCTNFVFSLPRDATPTFQTPLVALRWVLRFHFMAMRQGIGGQLEQLSWTLPLVVLPPPKAG